MCQWHYDKCIKSRLAKHPQMKADALQLRKCPNREEFEFMLANFAEKYSHLAAGRDFIRDYGIFRAVEVLFFTPTPCATESIISAIKAP